MTLTLCFVAVPLVATLRLVASGDHPGIGIGGLRWVCVKPNHDVRDATMKNTTKH